MSSNSKSTTEIMKAAEKQAALPQKTAADVILSQKKAEKMTKGRGDTKCPSGQILRSAYISQSGKAVPSKCIEKRGKSDTGYPKINATLYVSQLF